MHYMAPDGSLMLQTGAHIRRCIPIHQGFILACLEEKTGQSFKLTQFTEEVTAHAKRKKLEIPSDSIALVLEFFTAHQAISCSKAGDYLLEKGFTEAALDAMRRLTTE